MQARRTGERFDLDGDRVAGLLAVLAPGDEHAMHEAARAIAGWDGVRGVTVEVHPDRTDVESLVLTAGVRLRSTRRYVCRDLVDRDAVIGRLEVALEAGAETRALEADCDLAAILLATAAARWRLEGTLLEAQAYRVVGQIAAGLVHDFNNALTGISGNATVAHALALPGDRVLVPIQRIEDAARSAAGVARALLNFVRGSLRREPLSVNELAGDTQRVLSRAVRDGVLVAVELRDAVPWVEGERALLQQALVNLVLNAEQAIDGDGCVTIRTARVERLPEGVEGCPRAAAQYVALSVSDTGPGIAADTAGRVFEPFFTTKGSAGTGLGLASVLQVARRHGGAVGVESRPGEGATFTLYLPTPEAEGVPGVVSRDAGAAGLSGRGRAAS